MRTNCAVSTPNRSSDNDVGRPEAALGNPQGCGEFRLYGGTSSADLDRMGQDVEPVTAPIAIEVRLAGEMTVRGHEFPQTGPPVVFMHEPGRDLDAWGVNTARFAKRGFKVLALDLPGHGLSDGQDGQWEGGIAEVLSEITRQWGPVGTVAAGATCRAMLAIGGDDRVPTQALLSPTAIDEDGLGRSVPSTRLLMCGPDDSDALETTKAVFARVRGQKLMITGTGRQQGTDLLAANDHLLDELVMWFRRNLTAYHLAWIAEISSSSPSQE